MVRSTPETGDKIERETRYYITLLVLMAIILGPIVRSDSAIENRLLWVCAVERRRFPVGESPTRQSFQPEATGAVMEVTKWLKPSVSRVTNWGPRECAGRNASDGRASLEKDDVQADPTTLSGKADTAG
jgi:hypothetical protein